MDMLGRDFSTMEKIEDYINNMVEKDDWIRKQTSNHQVAYKLGVAQALIKNLADQIEILKNKR